MDEFELIEQYFAKGRDEGTTVLGIGDDGAVFDCPPDMQLVSVLDTLVDGVHYPHNLPAFDIGYRAVAVNLSDIAAMGGTPAWMLLGLTLPRADSHWLRGFSDGLFEAAGEYGVSLAGGDTTRGTQTVVTVQMSGFVGRDAYITRRGSNVGDIIVVSGTPGDAAAGLALLQKDCTDDYPHLVGRFRRPKPRVRLGQRLAGMATAAIDISDGLYDDLQRVLRASGCGGVIQSDLLPISAELLQHAGRDQACKFALAGGDDYELCFTLPASRINDLAALAADTDVRLTQIGTVEQGALLRVVGNGSPADRVYRGYRHF